MRRVDMADPFSGPGPTVRERSQKGPFFFIMLTTAHMYPELRTRVFEENQEWSTRGCILEADD